METETSFIVSEANSATSLPKFEGMELTTKNITPLMVTTSTSESSISTKEIVIRGMDTRSVTVQINIPREQVLLENLIANRGPDRAETTASHEG